MAVVIRQFTCVQTLLFGAMVLMVVVAVVISDARHCCVCRKVIIRKINAQHTDDHTVLLIMMMNVHIAWSQSDDS